jgi:hypothetical protein
MMRNGIGILTTMNPIFRVASRAVRNPLSVLRSTRTQLAGRANAALGLLDSISGKRPLIRICITTSKGYSQKTIPSLVSQLESTGILSKDIFIFEGGHRIDKKTGSEPNYYEVSHNSFDHTALISLIDFGLESDYWLFIHDTIEVLPEFAFRFREVRFRGEDCIALRNFPSMNIGFYRHEFLLSQKEFLFQIRNRDYSEEGLQLCKARGVPLEDALFTMGTKVSIVNPHLAYRMSITKRVVYGANRVAEYYPQLGIVKFKANFQPSDRYEIRI